MATCKYWKDQPDGFHGFCQHPESRPGDSCILNTEDISLLSEFVCSECGRLVDASSVPEADYYICEPCADAGAVKPGADVVPRGDEVCKDPWGCTLPCGRDEVGR